MDPQFGFGEFEVHISHLKYFAVIDFVHKGRYHFPQLFDVGSLQHILHRHSHTPLSEC